MHSLFKITAQEVQELNDTDARELISRLARAELRSRNISESYVTWGGHQKAKDGGVDVRVSLDATLTIDGYIPSISTVFQVKAEGFNAAKIEGEMTSKGNLRDSIKELANSNGTYIIVSTTDFCSDSSLKTRVDAMTATIKKFGFTGKVQTSFYDSRKIADWIEQHPSVFYWVKTILNKPVYGWKPYGAWAYSEHDKDSEYFIDESVRVVAPNVGEELPILDAIDHIRGNLAAKNSVRIVGLSGVGKTRLAQALFDERVEKNTHALDAGNVIYTDISDDPIPQPQAMIEELIAIKSDCVVIIDNCGPELHQKLTSLILNPICKIRLITIEYDIRDDLPDNTIGYRMHGSSNGVIERILKQKYSILSNADIHTIVRFSDGNARVALALASSSVIKGEIAKLDDAELFKRLFVQKNAENDDLLRAAEAGSLLYSFDFDSTGTDSEIALLAEIAGTSELSFSRYMVLLQQRGLLQERGKWRAILPHAISNRLAISALAAIPKSLLWDKFFTHASDRVIKSFSRRLGFLHESPVARHFAKELLSTGGEFSNLTKLTHLGIVVFENIAPLDQDATLAALLNAVKYPDFVSIENRKREFFAKVANCLAYQPNYFDRAVKVLIDLVLAEPIDHRTFTAKKKLRGLFYCTHSGSEATPQQRVTVLRELLISEDPIAKHLAVDLLEVSLSVTNNSPEFEYDFGARKRGSGLHPETPKEIEDWFQPFIELALIHGAKNTEFGKSIRVVVGKSIVGLIDIGLIQESIKVCNTFYLVDGFPEGWHAVCHILNTENEKTKGTGLSESTILALNDLKVMLEPKDLIQNIRAQLLTSGAWERSFWGDYEDYLRKEQEDIQAAQFLGESLGRDNNSLFNLLKEILHSQEPQWFYHFGNGIGKTTTIHWQILSAIKNIRIEWPDLKFNAMAIAGFLVGWQEKSPIEAGHFLDHAMADRTWSQFFPFFQVRVGLDASGVERLVRSIKMESTPVKSYIELAFGKATDPLSVPQISQILNLIVNKPVGGLSTALEILRMIVFGAKEKNQDYKKQLSEYCLAFLNNVQWDTFEHGDGNATRSFKSIAEFAFSHSSTEDLVKPSLTNFMEYGIKKNKGSFFRHGEILRPYFEFFPVMTLNIIYDLYSISSDKAFILDLLSIHSVDDKQPPISLISDSTTREWLINASEDKFLFAAHTCKLFEGNPESEEIDGVSDISKYIWAHAHCKKSVYEIFIDRFIPWSYSGLLSNILKKRLSHWSAFSEIADDEIIPLIEAGNVKIQDHINLELERELKLERFQSQSFE